MGIEQLIVSYWWIILLVAVVFFLLLRSLIKFLISIFSLTAIIYLFWMVFLSNGFAKAEQCFTDQVKSTESTNEEVQKLGPGTEQNQLNCSSEVENFSRLTDCLDQSRQENGFSFMVFSGTPKYEKTINEIITTHNNSCPDSPLSRPAFKE